MTPWRFLGVYLTMNRQCAIQIGDSSRSQRLRSPTDGHLLPQRLTTVPSTVFGGIIDGPRCSSRLPVQTSCHEAFSTCRPDRISSPTPKFLMSVSVCERRLAAQSCRKCGSYLEIAVIHTAKHSMLPQFLRGHSWTRDTESNSG